MRFMNAPVFVDTNVLVYARDASAPSKQRRARDWLAYLWQQRLGRTSMQVLSEFYVTVTRKLRPGLSPDDAWDDVTALLTWQPQAIDEALMQRGREVEQQYRLSWWDSLVVSAAQLQGCELILTEDLQDGGVYGNVTARSPFTLGLSENIPSYAVSRAPLRRHPPRGRPKLAVR